MLFMGGGFVPHCDAAAGRAKLEYRQQDGGLPAFSLAAACDKWFRTVPGDRPRMRAVSLLERPSSANRGQRARGR